MGSTLTKAQVEKPVLHWASWDFVKLHCSWKLAEVCIILGWHSPDLLEAAAMPLVGYMILLKHLPVHQPFLFPHSIDWKNWENWSLLYTLADFRIPSPFISKPFWWAKLYEVPRSTSDFSAIPLLHSNVTPRDPTCWAGRKGRTDEIP